MVPVITVLAILRIIPCLLTAKRTDTLLLSNTVYTSFLEYPFDPFEHLALCPRRYLCGL